MKNTIPLAAFKILIFLLFPSLLFSIFQSYSYPHFRTFGHLSFVLSFYLIYLFFFEPAAQREGDNWILLKCDLFGYIVSF